MNKKNL